MTERNFTEQLAYASLIFLGLVAFVLMLKTFATFLRPFTIALLLTLLIVPLLRFTRSKKVPTIIPILAIAAMIFLFIAIMYAVVGTNAPSFVSAIQESPLLQSSNIDNLPSAEFFGITLATSDFIETDEINRTLNRWGRNVVNSVGSFFTELFITIIFLIFLIPSHDRTINIIAKNLSRKQKTNLLDAIQTAETDIFRYLKTKLLISLGTALLSLLIMFLFQVPFMLTYALLIFLLNFIPNIGSIIAVVLAIVGFTLTSGFSGSVIILAILLTAVQILFGNILEPKIAGKTLSLSPVVIILSLFFWFWVWGILGMIIAIPLTSILKIALNSFESTRPLARMLG